MHTTKPSPESSLSLIHNGDYSGKATLLIRDGVGNNWNLEVNGPDFLELCETVATDTIMGKIEEALDR